MRDWKNRAKQLKTDIPAIFLAMKKKETPLLAKILGMVIVAYALSPIDLVPDFIPILGMLDDLILLPALIYCLIRLIPGDVFTQCRREAEGLWKDCRPKHWYYALPVILFWTVIIICVIWLWL